MLSDFLPQLWEPLVKRALSSNLPEWVHEKIAADHKEWKRKERIKRFIAYHKKTRHIS
jgi:hypothetical protein